MSADGTVYAAFVVEMASGFNVLLHIYKAYALLLYEFFLEAAVRVILSDDDRYIYEDYSEYKKYYLGYPEHACRRLTYRRPVQKRPEIYGAAEGYQSQQGVNIKLRSLFFILFILLIDYISCSFNILMHFSSDSYQCGMLTL